MPDGSMDVRVYEVVTTGESLSTNNMAMHVDLFHCREGALCKVMKAVVLSR